MLRVFAFLLALVVALPLWAQASDDKSLLEGFLEQNLSGVGREVSVTGFVGALSREATMDELTFADRQGVWLRMTGITLDWNRAAVLRGQFDIRTLSAEKIEILRLPRGNQGPQAQASDFALPDLPVSVDIGQIAAGRLELGSPVLGERVVLTLAGSAALVDGAGQASLRLERIDGRAGVFSLGGSFDNASRVAAVDVRLEEGASGIVATLAGLPGAPPVALTVSGEDPLEAFTAALALATDGKDRFSGTARVESISDPDAGTNTRIDADLSGDIRPLLNPAYQAFFGGESRLRVVAQRAPGSITLLDDLRLTTEALDLSGTARLGPGGWPQQAALSVSLGFGDDRAVVLPLAGPETRIDAAEVTFDYDAARGPDWTLSGALTGFLRDALALDEVRLTGTGTLASGEAPDLAGRIAYSVQGIELGDADLNTAVGDTIRGMVAVAKAPDAPFELSELTVQGADYSLTADVSLSTDARALDLIASGNGVLVARDLSRFAPLTGQALAGRAELDIDGSIAFPGGPFDVALTGTTRDLSLGIAPLDGVFAGANRVELVADRTLERTALRRLSVEGVGVRLEASGILHPQDSTLDIALDLPEAARLDPRLSGAISAMGAAEQDANGWTVTATAKGPGGAAADIAARAETLQGALGPVTARLDMALDSLAPYSTFAGRPLAGAADLTLSLDGDLGTEVFALTGAGTARDLDFDLGDLDRLWTGEASLAFALNLGADGALSFEEVSLETAELDLSASGDLTAVAFDARLRDMSVLVPDLTGAFSAEGTARLAAAAYEVDITGAGPGGTRIGVAGQIDETFETADLRIHGLVPLALANTFTGSNRLDGTAQLSLSLAGPLQLANLAGTVTSNDARLALPTLRTALDPIRATLSLSGGRAQVDASAQVRSGGQIDISGPITLAQPFDAALSVTMSGVGLADPALYDTRVDGAISVTGPLTGGATIAGEIRPGRVEIRIPSSGFGVAAAPEGLTHANDSAAARATRARAAQISGKQSGAGPAYALDIVVSAPNQVFIRGRGLDAELGGTLRLLGTTQDVRPQGGLDLIRGRLSLMGNRIDLAEATATLEGDLDPYIDVVAISAVEDVTILVRLQGQVTDPVLTLASSPDLPQDELLARLILGRPLSEISPLQALTLANGIATLSGRSGSGLIDRFRTNFGLADLDIGTNETGAVSVTAGTYVTDNVYAGVEVGADGQAEVTLNLDLSPNLTARGSMSNTSGAALGVYFEKDY